MTRPRHTLALLATASLATSLPAATFLPTAPGTYLWSDFANWSPSLPLPPDPVTIAPAGLTGPLTLLLDTTYYPATPLGPVTLDSATSTHGPTLSQSISGQNLAATSLTLADTGRAAARHSAGTTTVTQKLTLAQSPTSSATYSLSGTAALHAFHEHLAYAGRATFTHTGGTHSLSPHGSLTLATTSTASASYSLSGTGTLSTGNTYVAFGGNATFTQTGGTHVVSNQLTLGESDGSLGSYGLTSGYLITAHEQIGGAGRGSFGQYGGTHVVTGSLTIGSTGSFGSFTLSRGSLAAGTIQVNANGQFTHHSLASLGFSSFVQTGGTATFNTDLTLGALPASTASYSLSGGILYAPSVHIGRAGTGLFSQTGGYNGATTYLGYDPGSTGSYTMSGTGSLWSTEVYVGYYGNGSVHQSGGSMSSPSIGEFPGSTGTYTFTGGTLAGAIVGVAGTGSFTHPSGTVSGSGTFTLASKVGSTGSYSISGTAYLLAPLLVADRGTASVTQNGGTVTSRDLILARYPGSSASYTLSAGKLGSGFDGWGTSHSVMLAQSGTASFIQTGGIHKLGYGSSSYIHMATNAGSSATYSLSGTGILEAANVSLGAVFGSSVSDCGAATLSISGGLATINDLRLRNPRATLRLSDTGTLRLTSLPTLAPGSTFDLAGGTLVLGHYTSSTLQSLRALLLAGRADGAWTGTGAISSSAAAHDPRHLLALAYAPLPRLPASNPHATRARAAGANDTSLVTFLTLYGDANLNGTLDPDDFALLDKGHSLSLTNALWTDGDFNYDGQVNQQDYLLIDSTLAKQQGGELSPALLAQRAATFGPAYLSQLLTSIPEPSLALLSLFAPPLIFRPARRRISPAQSGRARL